MIPFIQSCSDDAQDAYSLTYGTVVMIDQQEYYFLTDAGKKMYPGEKTDVAGYNAEDGKRVLISYRLLEEKINGYDINAHILFIDDLMMKDIVNITTETESKIGNDPINISLVWIAGNCINIEFRFMGTADSNKKHLISLAYNAIEKEEGLTDKKEFLELELRHNAYDDYPNERLNGLIAFKQPLDLKNYGGIKIHYTSIYEGEKTYELDFDKVNNQLNVNTSSAKHAKLYH